MQVTINKIIGLIGCTGALRGAINDVLGERAADAGYQITQADVQALADALDARYEAAPDLAAKQYAIDKQFGALACFEPKAPHEIVYEARQSCTHGVQQLERLIEIAGLANPYAKCGSDYL